MNAIDIFPWDDNFNTGIDEIDEQHKRLVLLLNKLASHVAFRSDTIELNSIFDELIDYTVYHFETEEKIWDRYFIDDKAAAQHQATHASFVDMVQLLKDQQDKKPLRQIAEEALDYLVRWLASHILETDRFMAYAVAAIQAGKSLDEAKAEATERMTGATRSMIDIILSIYSTLSHNTLQLMRKLVEQEEAEAALRQSKEELLKAKERAEAANRAKSQFLATISHEIRTPLNGVLGMAQLLLLPGLSQEEQNEFVHNILSSGNTLLALLNDVLDVSKVEAGKMDLVLASVSPAQLLDDVSALMGANAHTKGLCLSVVWNGPTLRHYSADPVRIRQMLTNLVSNAIKFTEHGSVAVEASETNETTIDHQVFSTLRFAVTDTGIGIPADKLEYLFQPFTQLDSSDTRQFGGTGLGLSIVRSLAERMNGLTGVKSQPGVGSTFWFEIPLEVL
ncbi:MAG: hypothetical protein RIR18_1580 [Pseudomonadota bacterium]|jgi:hemerythrin-like metal-binding protein